MKSIIAIAFCLAFYSANAQFSIGAAAGLFSCGHFYGSYNISKYAHMHQVNQDGYNYGIIMNKKIAASIDVSAGIFASEYRYRSLTEFDNVAGYYYKKQEVYSKTSALEVPLSLNFFMLDDSNFKIAIGAGGMFFYQWGEYMENMQEPWVPDNKYHTNYSSSGTVNSMQFHTFISLPVSYTSGNVTVGIIPRFNCNFFTQGNFLHPYQAGAIAFAAYTFHRKEMVVESNKE